MVEITTIGLDIGKRVLQVHGADAQGRKVLQRKLRRDELRAFFAALPPCLVGMEACATAHYWGRELRELGHDVHLIPPSYVKPYVVRQKNDAADAAAICEAVTRPNVRTTPIKTADQQAARVMQRTHELLSRQRVTLINAVRGHLAEFGILAPAGPQHMSQLIERVADPTTPIPALARNALNLLIDQLVELGKQIDQLEAGMKRRCKADPDGARLLGCAPAGGVRGRARSPWRSAARGWGHRGRPPPIFGRVRVARPVTEPETDDDR